jgi:hypothetical protein
MLTSKFARIKGKGPEIEKRENMPPGAFAPPQISNHNIVLRF